MVFYRLHLFQLSLQRPSLFPLALNGALEAERTIRMATPRQTRSQGPAEDIDIDHPHGHSTKPAWLDIENEVRDPLSVNGPRCMVRAPTAGSEPSANRT